MRLRLNVAELFRVAEVARMLGFADIREAALHLTAAGHPVAADGIQERNRRFAEHQLRCSKNASTIQASRSRFLE